MLVTKRVMVAFMSIVFSVLLVCILARPLHAAFEDNDANSRVVKIGCTEMNGFFDMDANKNSSGFAYELMREVSMYTGQKYEFVKTSYDTGRKLLQEGKIDLFLPMQKTEKNQRQYEFSSEAFASNTAVLLAKPNSSYCYGDFGHLNGITIGTMGDCQNNGQLVEYLQKYGCRVKLKKNYADFSALQKALGKGDIDALLTSSNRKLSNCKIIAQFPSTDVYVTAKKGNTRLIDNINYALRQIELNTPYFRDNLDLNYLSIGENVMPAYTKAEVQYVRQYPQVTMVVNGEFRRKSEIKSLEEFIKQIQTKSGLKIKLMQTDTIAAAYNCLSSGEADAILPINRDVGWAQTSEMWLTQPFLSMGSYRIRKAGNTQLKTIAVLKDSYQTHICGKEAGQKLVYCDSTDQAVNMVLKGCADATYCNRLEGDYFSSQPKYSSRLSFIMDDSGVQQYAIGISQKNDSILISIFNKALGCIPSAQVNRIFSVKYDSQKMSLIDYFSLNPEMLVVFCVAICMVMALIILFAASNAVAKKKNKQLESASRAKSDFLARMSHDLRTPMNAIMGLSHLGMEECAEVSAKDYFNKINSSSTYLLSLINDILDMSRIENKKIELHPEPVHMEEFYQSVCTIMQPLLDEKHINFVVEKNGLEVSYLLFDRIHMQQILLNLLTNAVKFSRNGGRIRLTCDYYKKENHMVYTRITVRDYGIGMNQEFLRKIFIPFEQEHNMQLPEQTGTGLGLAIVKNLVDMMGGTISVKSELGEGSAFTLELLLREVDAPKKIPESVTDNPQHLLSGLRVLLVEDHPLNTEIARRLLQKRGVLTDHAENGKVAVQMFQNSEAYHYDAILMDIRMPVMNGLEAAKAIRALVREDAGKVPIIAMSANAFDEDVKESIKVGMNAHLAKPIEPQRLYEELEKLTAGSQN